MTPPVLGVSLRNQTLNDLAATWLTVAAVLFYLDVPPVNVLLFATAIVLQAATGTFVIVRLIKNLAPSLLLLLGPGLVLGGATAFIIFQILGRGIPGVVALHIVGVISVVDLARRTSRPRNSELRWWTLGQLAGMALLAVSSEFAELMPMAAVLFFGGYVISIRPRYRTMAVSSLLLFGLMLSVWLALRRQNYWWWVTDDYSILEVIARHLVTKGPFADWGVTNFSRYHWLSYGWSGLLNLLGGSPLPYVTLSKVMPIVYSLSLASSLVLTSGLLRKPGASMSLVIPAWVVVGVGRFDWTGTSTAGAFAVLASLFVIILLIQIHDASLLRSALLLLAFFAVAFLTKSPTIFAVLVAISAAIIERVARKVRHPRVGAYVPIVLGGLTIMAVFLGIWFFGLVTDRSTFTRVNPGLGQLSEANTLFAAVTLILGQLWLWPAVFGVLRNRTRQPKPYQPAIRTWVASSSLGLLCGLGLELTLTTSANGYTYFCGPMYFLASLAFLVPNQGDSLQGSAINSNRDERFRLLGVLVAGIAWRFTWEERFGWEFVLEHFVRNLSGGLDLLRFYIGDFRVGATVAYLLFVILQRFGRRTFVTRSSLQLALVLLTFLTVYSQTAAEYERRIPREELEAQMGPRSIQDVGTWMRNWSRKSDLVATNFHLEDYGGSMVEYALAAWTEREFLALGPQISGSGASWTADETSARTSAFELSEAFANEPSEEICQQLQASRVEWYIVDVSKTVNRDWSICSVETFRSGNFRVLRLTS